MHIVIRAGGVGARLWPISTSKRPKQFQPIIRGKSTFTLAIDRVRSMIRDNHHLIVSVSESFAPYVKSQLKGLKDVTYIIEPTRRNTAAAVGLEAVYVFHRDPDGVITGVPSDHVIKDIRKFQKILRVAEKYLQSNPEYIFSIGIKPTFPHAGLGYIEMGDQITKIRNEKIFQVVRFKEKPDKKTAKRFIKSGKFVWNANLFVFKAQTILSMFQKFEPGMYQRLMRIEKAIGTPRERATLNKEYPKIKEIAVEYAIMEKAKKMAVVQADIGWTDIGSFKMLRDVLVGENNLIDANHVGIDTSKSVIIADKKKIVATIGLEHMAVIDTPDALLVCSLEQVQEIKQIVEKLTKKNLKKYI